MRCVGVALEVSSSLLGRAWRSYAVKNEQAFVGNRYAYEEAHKMPMHVESSAPRKVYRKIGVRT